MVGNRGFGDDRNQTSMGYAKGLDIIFRTWQNFELASKIYLEFYKDVIGDLGKIQDKLQTVFDTEENKQELVIKGIAGNMAMGYALEKKGEKAEARSLYNGVAEREIALSPIDDALKQMGESYMSICSELGNLASPSEIDAYVISKCVINNSKETANFLNKRMLVMYIAHEFNEDTIDCIALKDTSSGNSHVVDMGGYSAGVSKVIFGMSLKLDGGEIPRENRDAMFNKIYKTHDIDPGEGIALEVSNRYEIPYFLMRFAITKQGEVLTKLLPPLVETNPYLGR